MSHLQRVATYLSQLKTTEYEVSGSVANIINFFLDSYLHKLDERSVRNSRNEERIPSDLNAHIKELWLGCEVHTAVTLNRKYPTFAKNHNAYAFYRLFHGDSSSYDIIPFMDSYQYKELINGSYYYRVQSEQISISPTEQMTLPIFGNFFVTHRGSKKHMIVSLDLCYESMGCNISVMVRPDDQDMAENFFNDMGVSLVANDIYWKQCISFERGKLDFLPITKTSWGQIILKPQLKDTIRHNTVNILDSMTTLNALGMCPNRNVIMISPPGMAKTTIFRAICNDVVKKMTCLWCTGKSIDNASDVTSLFEAARSLAPCLVFIEDMDLFGHDRNSSSGFNSHVLNEFLACLDGTNENAGVVVLASTNDISSMDEALVNRPGRFDVKIEMPYPDADDRMKMLKSFFTSYHSVPDETVTNDTWQTVINLTDGLTGAYIKDLAKATVISAVAENRCKDGISCNFSSDNLLAAAEQCMRNYQIGQRAKKHHQALDE